MAEKFQYFDRIMFKEGLNELLFTNDGGKYSPSIRKLRQHYFPESRTSPEKLFSSSTSSFKCNDCHKHDGLFQCYHCHQRLCIRCCNKHYKKVTQDLEHLHHLNDQLVTKIFHMKTDLEKQKNQAIEQCHQWRIDTINTVNRAHRLMIQTVHDEYEIVSKEYENFIDKEMADIPLEKSEFNKIKRGNLSSLIAFNSTNLRKNSSKTISVDIVKERIESLAKRIDDLNKCSFHVKLPVFDIDDNFRVESSFDDNTRSISAIWQDERLPTESNSSLDRDREHSSNQQDSTYGTASSSSTNSLHNPTEDQSIVERCYSHPSQDDLAISTIQHDEPVRRRRHRTSLQNLVLRRRTTPLPIRLPISDGYFHQSPWFTYRTHSIASFLQ